MKAFALYLAAFLAAAIPGGAQNQSTDTSAVRNDQKGAAEAAPAVKGSEPAGKNNTDAAPTPRRLSPGLEKIVEMVQKGVEPQVLRTYVENSLVAYAVTPDDLIYLHQLGVPSDVLTAIIERTTALRRERVAAYQKQRQQAAQPKQPAAPAAEQGTEGTTAAAAPQGPNVQYNFNTSPMYPSSYYYFSPYPYYYSSYIVPFYYRSHPYHFKHSHRFYHGRIQPHGKFPPYYHYAPSYDRFGRILPPQYSYSPSSQVRIQYDRFGRRLQ